MNDQIIPKRVRFYLAIFFATVIIICGVHLGLLKYEQRTGEIVTLDINSSVALYFMFISSMGFVANMYSPVIYRFILLGGVGTFAVAVAWVINRVSDRLILNMFLIYLGVLLLSVTIWSYIDKRNSKKAAQNQ